MSRKDCSLITETEKWTDCNTVNKLFLTAVYVIARGSGRNKILAFFFLKAGEIRAWDSIIGNILSMCLGLYLFDKSFVDGQ